MKKQPRAPHEFDRRLLLAVAGTTPQILTETLYALLQAKIPFVPTEVHVVTTAEGEHRIRLELLDEKIGKFHAFCRDYGLTGRISFLPENVRVITDNQGFPLTDIISPADNEQAADQIVAWLRSFTDDTECAIHACLAGGRKTMGFYLGYGISLFGRKQDRLSHVLVSPDFEGHREFFYKPPIPQTLYSRGMVGAHVDERPISTGDAKIWLAEIPFVRLGEGLPAELLGGKASYTDSVQAVQEGLPDNTLLIDFAQRKIICGGIPVRLPPRELAFYAWHAKRSFKLGSKAPLGWKDTLGENNDDMLEYFSIYSAVFGGDTLQPDYLEARRAFSNGFGKDDWAGIIHHLNDRILKAIGKHNGEQFEIHSRRVNGASNLKRYGLDYPVERIGFVGGNVNL